MKKKIFLIILVILAALLLISRGKIVEYSTPVDTEVQIEIQKDLFEDYYEEANKIMSEMTLEEKVGQLFYARYPYNSNDEIVKENPGGYILFARDFKNETKESILQKINKNQENSKIKMFFGVDEEGGTVVRVSKYKNFRSEPFPSPQMLFEEGGFELVLSDLEEKMDLLKSIGINTNFAPVVDLPTKEDSYMYKRSFGLDLDNTIEFASLVVKKMNESKMISMLKHFPGYGDNVDTHTGVAVDNRTLEYLKEYDLKPFIAGIEANVPMILVNHNIITSIDDKNPASISKEVHDFLRDELGYTGLIITDDLNMGALKKYTSNKTAAVQAILAGNDMIVTSDFVNQKKEILNAIKDGVIEESLIDKAVIRIIACKLAYGII